MKTFITRDTLIFPIPTGCIFYDGFKKLGWKSFYIPPFSEGGKKLVEYDYEGPVDILIDCLNLTTPGNEDHINDLRLFKEQNPNCKIFVAGFLPYDFTKTSQIDKRFEGYVGIVDYFFNSTVQHSRAKEEFASIGIEYISIPYSSIVDPIELDSPYTYDTCFIGTTDSGERLTDIWYPEIIKPPLKTYLGGFLGKPRTGFEEMLAISKQSKVNLNPHYEYQIHEDPNNIHSYVELNTRVFNLATMGSFQLTNHTLFKKLFGEEYPVFDRYNFKDMLHYYLNNDDEREKVIRNVQKIALEKYTSKAFAEKISKNEFNFI
jgi:hypothetical protein